MTDSKLASFQRAIEAARTLMFQQAAAQKCVHPFRFMATNALKQVVWLAAVEIDDEASTDGSGIWPACED